MYVHCKAGRGRSLAIVLAYMVKHRGIACVERAAERNGGIRTGGVTGGVTGGDGESEGARDRRGVIP